MPSLVRYDIKQRETAMQRFYLVLPQCWAPCNLFRTAPRFIATGSHRRGLEIELEMERKLSAEKDKRLEDFRIEDDKVDYASEVTVPLKAGGCSFHHSLAMHRTDANRSSKPRIGLTVAYMNAESKYIGPDPQPEYQLVAGQSFAGCV